jgi:hypothetical protein
MSLIMMGVSAICITSIDRRTVIDLAGHVGIFVKLPGLKLLSLDGLA